MNKNTRLKVIKSVTLCLHRRGSRHRVTALLNKLPAEIVRCHRLVQAICTQK